MEVFSSALLAEAKHCDGDAGIVDSGGNRATGAQDGWRKAYIKVMTMF